MKIYVFLSNSIESLYIKFGSISNDTVAENFNTATINYDVPVRQNILSWKKDIKPSSEFYIPTSNGGNNTVWKRIVFDISGLGSNPFRMYDFEDVNVFYVVKSFQIIVGKRRRSPEFNEE